MTSDNEARQVDYDFLVVGAGFAGLNALYHVREEGYSALLVEAGTDVGGTWYWNRYPGARVDIESLEYSYAFRDDLQQEWEWSEKYAGQPEVRRYLQWVAEKLDLRRDMQFQRRVVSLHLDEDAMVWTAGIADADNPEGPVEHVRITYPVLATGFLSAPNLPDIPGIDTFAGTLVHTARWPEEGVELAGRRVGIIGTAASGVQVVQESAKTVGHLTVFQRTANWCFPLHNKPMAEEYAAFVKANYAEIRRLEHASRGPGMVLMDGQIVLPDDRSAMDLPLDEREEAFDWRWRSGGVHMGRAFVDLIRNQEANDSLRVFLERKIRELVKDPATADLLIPTHPPLTRRPPGESGYYEAFNRDNVELVDIKSDPIAEITPRGLRLQSTREFEFEILVCATGFDSGTGAALRIDIRGRNGKKLKEHWEAGARTHFGLMTTEFPNLFFLNGAQSPSTHFSPPLLCDYQSTYMLRLIAELEARGARAVEPLEDAQDEWCKHLNEVYAGTLIPQTDSWWMGANIPGKPRQALAYGGGFPEFRRRSEAAIDGFREFSYS